MDQVYRNLATSPSHGLSAEEVVDRHKRYGKNVLSPPPNNWLIKTLKYLYGGFGSVLLIAAILVFISWKPLGEPPQLANLALAIVLVIVWVIQAAFSFLQDWSSSRVMASIKNMLPDHCIALRDGKQQELLGSELVPGDIILIRLGDKLPADLRFAQVSNDAKFDRSILTGETLPLRGTLESTDDNYLETACIGLAGTHCVSGNGLGVVVATGNNSMFGRLAKLTNSPKVGMTTLEKEIYYFVAIIVAIMLIMILVVIAAWAAWLRHKHPGWINVPTLIVDCVSVAVAFIPEGLPIAVTASLTIVAAVMKKNSILCKSLKTVETLGAVNVICSDKTGTLTKNQMTVTDCLVGQEAMPASGAVERTRREGKDYTLGVLATAGALCNAAEFDAASSHLPLPQRRILGDATDQAILRFSESLGNVANTRNEWQQVYRIPFNSKDKFMIQVSKPVHEENLILFIKGAPDVLLPQCNQWLASSGEAESLTTAQRIRIEAAKDQWSREAKRVILLARKHLPATVLKLDPLSIEFEDAVKAEMLNNLELLGLVGIVDPPRDEIPEVIRTLRNAGIRVHMVTGDFKLTAQAIAAKCGIISSSVEHLHSAADLSTISPASASALDLQEDKDSTEASSRKAIVIDGSELSSLVKAEWDVLCKCDEIVFARTTPEQKLRIVKELQARGATVGMTGDGVNDAPSLKAADIGIAMGSGSDIAIEAADMVLLESFAGIVEAVKYGRVVFDNLKKTICYLLPAGSFSEFWPVITSVLFGLPQVLSSFLMIIICCFTDCAAATAIAYEKPEADVLLRPPRNPKKERLVDWKLIIHAYGYVGVIEAVSSFAMAYWFLECRGIPFSLLWFGFGSSPSDMTEDQYTGYLNQASSIYFTTLVMMQFFNLMCVRTRRLSLLQHPPLFRKATKNIYLFPAIAFAIAIAFFFNYVPRFQQVLGTAQIPVEQWFLPLSFGMGLLLIDEGRKWAVRIWPHGLLAKLAW